MAGWSLATGTYFAFHDDVLTRLIARQAEHAVRLRGPHRRTARPGRPHHQPPVARPGAVRAEARAALRRQATLESRASTLARRARSGADRLDQEPPDADAEPHAAGAQALADQRHGDLHHAAGPRSAAGIARIAGARGASPQRAKPTAVGVEGALAAPAARSTASRRGRPRRSTRSKRATTPRRKRIRGVLADLGIDAKQDRAGGAGRGGRRAVRAADAAQRRRRLRAPALSHQCRARAASTS